MFTKTKVLVSLLALIFAVSCTSDSDVSPSQNKQVQPLATAGGHVPSNGRAPCPDCNQPEACWYGIEAGGEEWTFSGPCGNDEYAGQPKNPPPPPPTFPAEPKIYCAPSNLPAAPVHKQVFKTSTAGSNCKSPIYYYTCGSGGAWLVPVNLVYGNAPTTNLYSGIHYQTEYNGTSMLYLYLENFVGYPSQWYYVVATGVSAGCNI
jgi:hypothetical protein